VEYKQDEISSQPITVAMCR